MLYRKLFLNFLILLLFIQIVFHYSGLEAIRYMLYSMELAFIFFSLFTSIKKVAKITPELFYLILFLVIIAFNLLLNQQNKINDVSKIFGGIVIFIASFHLYKENNKINIKEKKKVILIALLPLFIYGLDILIGFQESATSMSIFSNSNNYIFFSICCLWLMMIYDFSEKIIMCFIALSFAVTSTLGAFLAIVIATIFYFRKRIFAPRFFVFLTAAALGGGALILYSDLYLFERLRGTANVFYTLINDYSLKEFSNISFGHAMALSGSSDGSDVSFLFRIKLWTESLTYFFNQDMIYWLFGLGFGAIPGINSFGLVAHNDYLTWLVESGFFGFTLIVFGIWIGFLKLRKTKFIIPYLAILIYFFSENLFYNFFAISLFAFCLALTLQIVNNENFTD